MTTTAADQSISEGIKTGSSNIKALFELEVERQALLAVHVDTATGIDAKAVLAREVRPIFGEQRFALVKCLFSAPIIQAALASVGQISRS